MGNSESWRIKENSKSARHAQVLDLAAKLFTEQGYAEVSLEDIAGKLNISRAALYYYAKSKEDLLDQCAAPVFASLIKTFVEAQKEPTGRDALSKYIRDYLRIICSDIGHCLTLIDLRDLSNEGLEKNRAYRSELNSGLDKIIKRGLKDKTLRECDPIIVRRTIMAACNSFSRWYRSDRGIELELLIDNVLELFLNGLKRQAKK